MLFTANTQPSPIDLRDIAYSSPFAPDKLPEALDHTPTLLSVSDQLLMGTCVYNMLSNQVEQIGKANSSLVEYSRLYGYVMTKDYEGRMMESGLVPRDAYKIGYKYGLPTEAEYPYDPTLEFVLPHDGIHPLAFRNRLERYEAVVRPLSNDGGMDERLHRIKSALFEGMTVGFAMSITASLQRMTGPKESHVYDLVTPQSLPIGGHAMLIVGYDNSRRSFLVLNSWGVQWGDKGFCHLPYSIVMEPFFEAWVVRKFKGWEIPEAPGFHFEFMNKFRIEARYTAKPEDVGKKVNFWFGGRVGGDLYMRQPIPDNNLASRTPDNWKPISSGFRPTVTGHTLQPDTFIQVVQWQDLSALAGGEIYAAIGTGDLAQAEIAKLCTIPSYL